MNVFNKITYNQKSSIIETLYEFFISKNRIQTSFAIINNNKIMFMNITYKHVDFILKYINIRLFRKIAHNGRYSSESEHVIFGYFFFYKDLRIVKTLFKHKYLDYNLLYSNSKSVLIELCENKSYNQLKFLINLDGINISHLYLNKTAYEYGTDKCRDIIREKYKIEFIKK